MQNDRYTVFTPVFEGGGTELGALIAAAPKGDDPYYQQALNAYTALPSHMERKVYDDLNNIVAAAQTPYDKACAILRHLQRYYTYSLTPETPPENQDFVTYFMYVGRKGYCTYFASAMTVLSRMAGLPARYVEGFQAQPSSDGLAYVTGKDAHAWTEVYFEGFGWVPFDATPAQQNMDSQQNEPEPSPSPSPSPSPEPEDQPSPSPEPNDPNPSDEPEPKDNDPESNDDQEPPPPFPWWWLLAAVVVIAALTARVAARMPDAVAGRQKSERDKLFVYGSATSQLIRLLKRKPAPGETPLLFARRMDKAKAFPAPILPLWRMMALSNYSRMKPGADQTARAKETFLRMYKPQRGWVKLRFLARVAFDRGFYGALDTRVEHVEPVRAYAYQFKLKNQSGGKPAPTGKAETAKPAPKGKPKRAPAKPASPRKAKRKR